MTEARKYPLVQLEWLAQRLQESIKTHGKAQRSLVLTEFNLRFPDVTLTIGKLSRLYMDEGGNQEKFINRYIKTVQETDAKRDGIIAQALLDWNPRQASFATAYALAAKMVNEAFGTTYRADEIEVFIREGGGTLEFLFDCGIEKATALKTVQRIKEPRIL